jgi:hypothetical protein
MNIQNLTPHSVCVYDAAGVILLATVPPSGIIARVSITRDSVGTVAGLPVFVSRTGAVTGLPDPAADTTYLVSALVRLAAPTRRDIFSPGDLIRNPAGQPVGCRGLDANG